MKIIFILAYIFTKLALCFFAEGLIYSIPSQRAVTLTRKQERRYVISRSPLEFRIRTTKEEDIDEIAALLSSTADEIPNKEKGNGYRWKAKMEHLHRLQAFKKAIKTRYSIIREGRKAFSRTEGELQNYYKDDGKCSISDSEMLRLIWNDNGSLRDYIRRAAEQSTDPHPWKDYNFALCPPNASHLQHMMITAENVRTGHIVGFCEIAMMMPPNDNNGGIEVYPTIANLVTACSYRRRGIGRSLLDSVKKYVKLHWNADKLALYVKKCNFDAISLYSKEGFEELCTVDEKEECYMILDTSNTQISTLETV